ncbi:MAG: aminotransferase DegT [Candidatus Altiarchaeales archaeon ex4484_96]|nr:MAG: aminotransferase DegT [Candidatus Altiarchaeales archaeon ex4484_96]
MRIPIAKPALGEEEKKSVMQVLDSGMIACGSVVEELEGEFASYCQVKHGVATTSGTSALCVALKCLGVSGEDRVLTTPFSFIATANSILYCAAKPVFADIEEDSFNLDPVEVEKKLSEDDKITTLLLVHLYGLPCDMKPLLKLAREYQLHLVEDCAQAHGALYDGKKVGSFGDAGCFSFYPTKNMATGEGGLIVSDDDDFVDRSRLYINHGQKIRYQHDVLGFNYRLTNLQAALGLEQLKKLNGFNEVRIKNASFLTDGLSDLSWLKTPAVPPGSKHVFHQYTVRVADRDSFTTYLSDNGIGYGIHYPSTICSQPYYQSLGYDGSYPVAEQAASEVVSLPVHPMLTREELDYIVDTIRIYRR